MNKDEFVVAFDSLFAGRRDTYAVGKPRENDPTKYEWPRVREPLTPDLLRAHLKGEICIGIWPIVDGKVKWFAVDFDGPRNDDNAFDAAWTAAKAQYQKFEAAGLQCYIERSRSGRGCHVWGFLSEWMDAGLVRKVVLSLLDFDASDPIYDRVYPVQAKATEGEKLGNLLALPFWGQGIPHGFSTFLDPYSRTPIGRNRFLSSTIYFNQPALIEHLASKIKEEPKKTATAAARAFGTAQALDRPSTPITGALKMLSPYGCRFMRNAWLNRATLSEPMWHVAIAQCTYFEHGRELAHALSQGHPGYSEKQTNAYFDRKLQQPGHGCAYIHEHFPQFACTGCPMRAPYHRATRSLIEIANDSSEVMEELGAFQDDLALIRNLDAGTAVSGYQWGIEGMERYTRFRPNELTIIGGLPSIGKTANLVHNTVGLGRMGTAAFVFSGETSRTPLRQRLLAHAASVDSLKLRGEHPIKLNAEEWSRLDRAGAELKGLPIYTDYTTLTPEGVLAQVERVLLSKRLPLDTPYVIMFDYLQFAIREAGEDDRQHIQRSAGEFKFLAKVLEHPVAVYSQLTRGQERESFDNPPRMSEFAGSSAIERNADVCIIIRGQRMAGSDVPREVWIPKQRDGEANVKIDYVLHQATGTWRPIGQVAERRESLVEDFDADY